MYGTRNQSLTWWTSENEADLLHTASAHIDWMLARNAARRDWYHTFLSVYSGDLMPANPPVQWSGSRRFLAFNDTRGVIETIHSKISKQKPRPLFITDGGSYAAQEKAKKLTKYVDAKFHELSAYRIGSRVALDALLFGSGLVKCFELDGEVTIERIEPWTFFVGDADAADGTPSYAVQAISYDRQQLMEEFPEKEVQPAPSDLEWFSRFVDDPLADRVIVWELWRNSKNGGRHVVMTRDHVLIDEACHFLPFASLHYQPRPGSYWGSGIVESVLPLQLESNKLSSEISTAHHMLNKAKILVPSGATLPKNSVRNDIVVWEYDSTKPPPTVVAWSPVAPDVYQYHATLRKAIYELSGQSQLGATGQKPAGLNSGAALREYSDIETERFGSFAREFEQWYVDLARLLVQVQDSIGGNSRARFQEGFGYCELLWQDVRLPENAYLVKVFPVSSLPQHPAGRLQTIQELMQSGLITDPIEARRLLDFPDLEKATDLATAQYRLVESILERMLQTGEYQSPEPLMNLEQCYWKGLCYYHDNRDKDIEPSKLALLRRWILDVYNLMTGATQDDGTGRQDSGPGSGEPADGAELAGDVPGAVGGVGGVPGVPGG